MALQPVAKAIGGAIIKALKTEKEAEFQANRVYFQATMLNDIDNTSLAANR